MRFAEKCILYSYVCVFVAKCILLSYVCVFVCVISENAVAGEGAAAKHLTVNESARLAGAGTGSCHVNHLWIMRSEMRMILRRGGGPRWYFGHIYDHIQYPYSATSIRNIIEYPVLCGLDCLLCIF